MTELEIRRMDENDIPTVSKLLAEVNLIHHEIRPDLFKVANKYSDDDLAKMIEDEQNPIFVAEKAGRVLGYCMTQIQRQPESRILEPVKTLYIDDLYVDEDSRGLHVGQSLYEYAKAFAKQIGCHNVTLHVWNGNDAEAFYQRLGMKPQFTCMEEIL
ncbi:GNAT family N-acetyltransferase [Lactobacillus sp.]|uniref:GNAT family N-acetyltransferase n=1 Tax=Lactobacillus sp. TaxID=1591 RepID=UPI003EF5F99D